MEMNYATKGVANAGLTTGIIGTALGGLTALGGRGGRFGGGRCANNDPQSVPVSRYELSQEQTIADLKAQVADVTIGDTTVAQTTYNPLPVDNCGC